MRIKCIHSVSLVGVFENKAGQTQIGNGYQFFCRNLKILMWRTYGFNKAVPHDVQHANQFNYCKIHFPIGSFHVLVTRIGLWTFFFGVFFESQAYVNKSTTHLALKAEITSMNYNNIYGKFYDKSAYMHVISYKTSWCLFYILIKFL